MSLSSGLAGLLNRLVALDRSLSARLTLGKEAKWRRRIAVVGAHLGDGLLWLVSAVIAFGVGSEETRHFVLRAAVAVIVAGGLTAALKFLMRRGRPRERAGFYSTRYDHYSFPSGHATRAACLALVFSHQCPGWVIAFYASALFVAICRVALGIHYVSDVLAGMAVGFFTSWVIVSIQ